MKEQIIATLNAEILIEQCKMGALNEYPFNTEFQLHARVKARTILLLKEQIKKLSV